MRLMGRFPWAISESISLYFKASLRAKTLFWLSVFIHIEIRTNYRNKNVAFRLALKERLRGTQKWPIVLTINLVCMQL